MTRKSIVCGKNRIGEAKNSSIFFLENTHFPLVALNQEADSYGIYDFNYLLLFCKTH